MIAGALVGGGLYLGLRERARPEWTAPPGAPPAPPAGPRLGRDEVAARVSAALETRRAALRARCWEPLQGAGAPARPGRWTLQVTIGPGGTEAARGILEARGSGSPELTRCVLDALPPVAIEPPGTPIQVEVPLALP